MNASSCIIAPKAPNGENSKMYLDLVKRTKKRPVANWLYAKYQASNVKDVMERAGCVKNSQGEYKAEDVMNYLDYASMERDMSNIHTAELLLDAIDANGARVEYKDAKEALDKVDKFNDNHTGLVATVYQHGDIFNIHVSEKTARTHIQPTEVKEKLAVWEVYKQAFGSIGVDIENLPDELRHLFNANNLNIAQTLINLQGLPFKYVYKNDAEILFNLNMNTPLVQRAVNAFGSIENAAQAIDDYNHGGQLEYGKRILLERAVAQAQQFMSLDLKALQGQVSKMSSNVRNSSPEEDIRKELHTLNKKYNIDIDEIHLIGKNIETLSQATATAIVTLQRQIREAERKKGDIAESKRLEALLNKLMTELSAKKYYAGMIDFMAEAQALQADIDNMLTAAPQGNTEMEKVFNRADTIERIKTYMDQYYPIVEALADETVTIDESISQYDIDALRKNAKDIKDFFDKKRKVIRKHAEDIMQQILLEVVGDTAPDGQAITNLVKMAQTDSSLFDYLYSVGRASNPVIAAMGFIIRNAQTQRDGIMNELALRIRRATDKLYKEGYTSEFMYEDEEHIISDIDWAKYKAARSVAAKGFARQGLKGYDFKEALQQWEDNNTEDRVVDTKTGRTERVPDKKYRKAFPQLAPAQLEYYKTMMQIKGEIGSYLPSYAQRQYLVPQVRRNMLDALGTAKNAQDVWKAFKNKAQNLYKIREDDTNYQNNGIIDGEEYTQAYGMFDNTALREIPIFFVNRVEAGELLKDFSSGLQHLAGTAINYDAMNSIAQVVEFMGDFIKDMSTNDIKNRKEVVNGKYVSVIQDLHQWSKSNNTSAIVDGFILSHLYGEKRDPKDNPIVQKLADKLIGYTSFKGLSTNIMGAISNYLVGEFQMLIEAGCGEFYGFKDYSWAHTRLFGGAGAGGDIMELLTNNMTHKSTLMRELFDPLQENFSDKRHQRYYKSILRQLMSHDCSMIGYGAGEYLLHYVNMYAVLHHEKVKDANGKLISLYDAFEVGNIKDGNGELVIKQGITKKDGTAIDKEYIEGIKNKIRYVNQTTHGSMNEEDKGLIHRRFMGRMVMNFRQWMVEHYSRRFRKKHFDASLKGLYDEDGNPMWMREGYWRSLGRAIEENEAGENWRDKHYAKALGYLLRDVAMFALRAQTQWSTLDAVQRNNIKRAHTEFLTWLALLTISFGLGEPEEHKKEFYRRVAIYQVKRMLLDYESAMPHPRMPLSFITILNSPMAAITTLNGLLYLVFGYEDINEEIKTGPHKGENKYWRTIKKNTLPGFKHWEQIQEMDKSEDIFHVFKLTN